MLMCHLLLRAPFAGSLLEQCFLIAAFSSRLFGPFQQLLLAVRLAAADLALCAVQDEAHKAVDEASKLPMVSLPAVSCMTTCLHDCGSRPPALTPSSAWRRRA